MSIKNTFFLFFLIQIYFILIIASCKLQRPKYKDPPEEEKREDEIPDKYLGYISLKFKQHQNYLISSVKMGTPPQDINLILDIGSIRTWISNKFYDKFQSSSYISKDTFESHKQYNIKYNGILSMENFEIENKTLEEFQFLLVDKILINVDNDGVEDLQFIIDSDLIPKDNNNDKNDKNIKGVLSLGHEYDSKHVSLVYEMSHVCNTFYNMFMFKFGENNEGELLIGDMSEDQKRKYSYINKCRFIKRGTKEEQIKWRCELTQIFIGAVEDYPTFRNNMMEQTGYIISRNDKNNIAIVEEVATFETIFNRIYVPRDVMDYLKEYYFKNIVDQEELCEFLEKENEMKVRCSLNEVSKLKRLNFVFDGKTDLSFPSQNLFECDINGRCKFLIEFNKKYNKFIFGLPVFKMYNIIFDYNARDLSFYSKENKYLVKMAKNVGTKMVVIFLICIVIGLIMFLLGIGIVYCLRLKNRKREIIEEKIYEQF